MNRNKLFGLGVLAIAAAIPFCAKTPVLANLEQASQSIMDAVKQAEVKLELSAATKEVTLDKEGKEVIKWTAIENGATVQPGDIIRYSVNGANVGQTAAADLEVIQPVPQGTVYELQTAKSNSDAKLTYSIDGAKSFVANPTIKVKLATGEVVEKPAPANLYTHVKWNFSQKIDPTMAVKAEYEVKVPTLEETAAADAMAAEAAKTEATEAAAQ
jgi:uncharacterized repeat protein (TIGR01451 family)